MADPLYPLHALVNLILPPRCVACGEIISAKQGFCGECWSKLSLLGKPCCSSCGLPLPFEGEEDQQCAACLAKRPRHDGIFAVAAYDDISSLVILKLKHGGKIGLAKLIGDQLLRHLPAPEPDLLLVPVPLHWTRLWSRSFNQSALIARHLSRRTTIKHKPDILRRRKRTQLLRGKSGKERKAEVAGAFILGPRQAELVEGKDILLVDDVYTTGATCDACVRVLKKAGARSVRIYCWARVLRDENSGP